MALRYPFLLILIIIITIIFIITLKKKKKIYNTGTKVANTSYIKNNSYYKEKEKQYRIISTTLKSICLIIIFISAFLISRPNKIKTVDNQLYNRDIMLCMDVSSSVYELDEEIAKNLQSIVSSLKEERFGISIFNSSSVLLVPLTNDYDYVLDSLKKIEKAMKAINTMDYDNKDYFDLLYYIQSGTLEGNGGSLIGDGLASCVYSFPNLEEDQDRTRLVILTTDNELYGEPFLTLDEAATLTKKKNVKLYGIATDIIKDSDLAAFESAAKKTGGVLYQQGKSSVSTIVKNIEKESKSLIEDNTKTYQIDIPQIPFILLLLSTTILIYLDSKVIS